MTLFTISRLPPDPEGMNGKRSHWANVAIAAFQAATLTDKEEVLVDRMTDLMHCADRHGFNFEAAMKQAHFHYEDETSSGGEE